METLKVAWPGKSNNPEYDKRSQNGKQHERSALEPRPSALMFLTVDNYRPANT